ncbi:MAG: tryptophan synthase, beta subunit [Actinomycetia bacterium]|nr:tryptophan synthase, beta subunit [Actinomycetes bacterium]
MPVPARGLAVELGPPGPEPTGLGRFGEFGGRYVPETLVAALEQLEREFRAAWTDDAFKREYADLLGSYAGRPTPVTECANLSERLGVRVLLKREDLTHTGSHKINNVLGQALLTRRMGKRRVIAETGAGQHGVATATAAALFGLDCTVYMGAVDVERQALNVWRMRLLGADVVPVNSGSATLKDAVNDAMREWVASVERTHYCLGSAMGPHPFPWMVREFQRVVGDEARKQCQAILGADPDYVVACVGGGSNAIGTFSAFVESNAKLVGVEAGGLGLESGHHGAAIARGVPGYVHGMRSLFLQDEFGQVLEATSISAGLDYPGVGPEHAMLAASGRAEYFSATDDEALLGFKLLSATEGIVPALEPAHAIGWLQREAGRSVPAGSTVLLTLSGRGDKDAAQVAEMLGEQL